MVRPVTATGEALPLPVPLGVHVVLYWLIGLPPLLGGGVKPTLTCMSDPVPIPIVGAPGATALMVMLCVIWVAALKFALPP